MLQSHVDKSEVYEFFQFEGLQDGTKQIIQGRQNELRHPHNRVLSKVSQGNVV